MTRHDRAAAATLVRDAEQGALRRIAEGPPEPRPTTQLERYDVQLADGTTTTLKLSDHDAIARGLKPGALVSTAEPDDTVHLDGVPPHRAVHARPPEGERVRGLIQPSALPAGPVADGWDEGIWHRGPRP